MRVPGRRILLFSFLTLPAFSRVEPGVLVPAPRVLNGTLFAVSGGDVDGRSRNMRTTGRYSDLKRMLDERRREIMSEVQGRIRDQRESDVWGKVHEVLDAGESSEADIQEDLEFALIQMKAETLTKINDALGRLEAGTYGYCSDCSGEISGQRLRALPFAVRCKECEEAREVAAERVKTMAQKRGGSSYFFDMSS
jgi:DnaK suppressor protein